MTDNINEQISALLDNELDLTEARNALDYLQGDDSLRQQWDHYHLIGDAMRGEAVRLSVESIADRVRAKLDNEAIESSSDHQQPVPISRNPRYRARWLKTAGGGLLAASVAAITVIAFPPMSGTVSDVSPQLVVENSLPQIQAPETQAAPYLVQSSSRWKNLSKPKVESKLNRYLIDHNEYVAPGGIGVIPYTSFVSYDTDR
ncbi:sigma-E factor negative regulatory protein [Sedimenticola selenatireducens]|nr:sigma-E factor negative regulatory protein [Sedimenticola selenatireducens]